MIDKTIELFCLKCAIIESEMRSLIPPHPFYSERGKGYFTEKMKLYVNQFERNNKNNALKMSRYYELFYMVENDIRKLICETLEEGHGEDWWDKKVSEQIKLDVRRNKEREANAGVTIRSNSEIDYTTFGQLSDIIKDNWRDFAGIMSSQQAVSRVMSALNMLRGTIAHCGMLADDEIDRLELAIKDWFRILQGPNNHI